MIPGGMQGSENVRCSAVYVLLRFVASILVLVAVSDVYTLQNMNEASILAAVPHEYDTKYTLGDRTDADYLQECLPASGTSSSVVPFGLGRGWSSRDKCHRYDCNFTVEVGLALYGSTSRQRATHPIARLWTLWQRAVLL